MNGSRIAAHGPGCTAWHPRPRAQKPRLTSGVRRMRSTFGGRAAWATRTLTRARGEGRSSTPTSLDWADPSADVCVKPSARAVVRKFRCRRRGASHPRLATIRPMPAADHHVKRICGHPAQIVSASHRPCHPASDGTVWSCLVPVVAVDRDYAKWSGGPSTAPTTARHHHTIRAAIAMIVSASNDLTVADSR